jgi:hypothetical protein
MYKVFMTCWWKTGGLEKALRAFKHKLFQATCCITGAAYCITAAAAAAAVILYKEVYGV